MLMEWYSSDTARAAVRDQLAPLEKLGPGRAETAIQTLAAYLDEQGSIVKTAQRLHLQSRQRSREAPDGVFDFGRRTAGRDLN